MIHDLLTFFLFYFFVYLYNENYDQVLDMKRALETYPTHESIRTKRYEKCSFISISVIYYIDKESKKKIFLGEYRNLHPNECTYQTSGTFYLIHILQQ